MAHWLKAAAVAAVVGCFVSSSSASGADVPLRIGMVQGMFRDVQPSVVQALARPFRMLMERQIGLTCEVEICPDALTLAKKIKEQKLDLGVVHGFEFAWIKPKHADILPVSIAVPHGTIVQAMIVVHTDCRATKLDDFEGESVLIPRGIKAHCPLYLEKLRAGVAKTAARTIPKTGLTPEEALNAVANGEAPAALVDASSYSVYQTLQPGLAKKLKLFSQSETFPQSVLISRKGALKDETQKKLTDGLSTAHKTAQYKPLMMMWNLQGFENVPKDYDAQLEKCLQHYPTPNVPPATESSKKE